MICKELNKIIILFIICFSIFITACAPRYKAPNIKAEYYPQCVKPFQDLANAQKALIQRTVLTGALGAAGGALIGGLVSGDLKGAIFGGIATAIVASTTTYAIGKQKQIKDVKKRLISYRTDMRVDINNMSQIQMYSMLSLQCYIREFKGLLNNYKAHMISEEDFKKRYSEIQIGMKEISKILDEAYNQSVQRDQEFRDALTSERELANKKAKNNRSLASAEKNNTRQIRAINKANSINKMEYLVHKTHDESKQTADKNEVKLKNSLDNKVDANLDSISNDFDSEYTSGTVKLASTKMMYTKTLDIMNEATSHAGIDMVEMINPNTSTLYALNCI